MNWIEPKTNWQKTDTFTLAEDYARIKGNIAYLYDFSQQLYAPYTLPELGEYTIDQFPYVDFFNNVAGAVDGLLENTYRPPDAETLRSYEENGPGWSEIDLNAIEKNLNLVYIGYKSQWNLLPMLAYEMGGSEF